MSGDGPRPRGIRPEVLADPVAALEALGARFSPDFAAYAAGELDVSQVRCLLCGVAPCQCRQCEAPYSTYLGRARGEAPRPCGMTLINGECPRGHGQDGAR
jgi:hypothetical protein